MRLWNNRHWLTVIAYILVTPYLWMHPPEGPEGGLIVAFFVLLARASVIELRIDHTHQRGDT